jgi:hypothetical protein
VIHHGMSTAARQGAITKKSAVPRIAVIRCTTGREFFPRLLLHGDVDWVTTVQHVIEVRQFDDGENARLAAWLCPGTFAIGFPPREKTTASGIARVHDSAISRRLPANDLVE